MTWSLETSLGQEVFKVAFNLVQYTRGFGLDLGAGPDRVWPHFLTVDSGKDYGGRKVADVLCECDDLKPWADGACDFVVSSHLLEHIQDYKTALKEWFRVIRPGGHLCLYLPHRDLYPRIGQPGSNPDHKHDFCNQDIVDAMREVCPDWTLLEDEVRGMDYEYSFFQVFRKEAAGTGQVEAPWKFNPKSCVVIRYGAFGDALQASSILPGLKAQGWEITFNTNQRGHDILKHDPSIDHFIVQSDDQVPNQLLFKWWEHLETRFGRVINLSESVETTLLPDSGRVSFYWPDTVRRKLMDVNYVEFTHLLAEVPMPAKVKFHDTIEEQAQAKLRVATWSKGNPFAMLCLAGSSVHKRYPFLPDLIWFILGSSNVAFVTVGDASAATYELDSAYSILKNIAKLEPEKIEPMTLDERIDAIHRLPQCKGRWIAKSGRMPIRETMALAKRATVVFGPETGVMNAVSMMPRVQKMIMLSHSSHENLTRDWPSTLAIKPTVKCYPCHRLHRDHSYCPMDEKTGMALCASLEPVEVFKALMGSIEQSLKTRKAMANGQYRGDNADAKVLVA